MRNLLLVMLTMIVTLCISSCNEKKAEIKHTEPTIEQIAKEQLAACIGELALNPETFKVSNLKTRCKNDSVCVLDFKALGENGFGGHIQKKMQYVLIKKDSTMYELWHAGDILHSALADLRYDAKSNSPWAVRDDIKLLRDNAKTDCELAYANMLIIFSFSLNDTVPKETNINNTYFEVGVHEIKNGRESAEIEGVNTTADTPMTND